MKTGSIRRRLLAGLSIAAFTFGLAPHADALTVRDDVTVEGSEDRADDPQYDGVVQIYMLSPTGGVFFNCTGSMINPRTVISAAHCFNARASTDYGLAPGQFTPIVAYGPDTFDGLFNWLNTGSLTLDERNGITFGSQVIIHPDADPAFGTPLSFPGADVAMVALNDPLSQLPTYSMMFSQLPVGTHVQMVAYGGHGIGSTGDVGIDGKRQAGENILGLVGSQNDFIRGLFGTTDTYIGGPDADQLLYHVDFDNPVRNPDACSRDNDFLGNTGLVCDDPTKPINGIILSPTEAFIATDDIDLFPGDALPFESGTAGGDSGSALFADEIVEGELIITGVLSGGWTFVAPAPSGYADTSYYNPLFLFHDFIAEANPYKYVSSVGGDGNWSNADHWVQDLDPGYLILDANGNVVNGLPEGPELGVAGTDPREGIVFDVDINDLIPPEEEAPAESATDENGLATSIVATTGAASGLVASTAATGSVTDAGTAATGLVTVRPEFGQVPGASFDRPAVDDTAELVTFLYGDIGTPGPWSGPGATGGVPNNGLIDGFMNYFEVTLGSAGTTTADIDVVIDKLKITDADATLSVSEGVQFVSLVDTQIMGGTLDVNGVFGSRDILNMGLVTGGADGLIVTDTLFNMGLLDAGGGLGVEGDVVFTSGGALRWSGGTLDVDGDVSLAGAVTFADTTPGQSGTLLTHTGERIGTFSTAGYNTGVRRLEFTYGEQAVTFDYFALAFSDFVGDDLEPNQAGLAELLDELRGDSFSELEALYNQLDFLAGPELVAAFDRLTPTGTFQAPALSQLSASTLPGHLDRRFTALSSGQGSGMAFNTQGRGLQLASLNNNDFVGLIDQAEALENGGSSAPASTTGERSYGFFGEVSFSSGEQETGIGTASSDVSGTTVTLGADGQFTDALRLGVFGSYSDGESDFQTGLGATESDGFVIGAFGLYEATFGNVTGYAGFGQRDMDLARNGLTGMLTASTDADEIVAGFGVHHFISIDAQNGYMFMPEARVDYQAYDISGYEETGGLGAMAVEGRELSSLMVKVGGDLHFYDFNSAEDTPLRPSVGARIVYDLDGERDTTEAALVSMPGMSTTLVGASRDKAWGEVQGALHFGNVDSRWGASLFIETTVDRGDLNYSTFGFNIRGRF